MKYTDVKCKNCNKVIGKLDVDGKPVFKTLKEGVTEYNGLFCNQKCLKEFEELNKEVVSGEFWNYLNSWAEFDKHKECLDSKSTIGKEKRPNHITKFGEGYNQAVRDIFDKVRSSKKGFQKDGVK